MTVNHGVVSRCARGVLVLAVVLMAGCWGAAPPSPTKITEFRPVPETRETLERTVARGEYAAAVDRSKAADRLRIVPVFRRETAGSGALPEYRLFDVGANTPYAFLGLETADILVAANDYVIYEPEGFRRYVKLLGGEKEVSIEVVRGGKPTLLRTTFAE